MPSPVLFGLPSKGQINRCGDFLVMAYRDKSSGDQGRYRDAFSTLDAFRAQHQIPTNKVTLGLRSMVRTSTGETPVVSQRLKRAPRIIRKLSRADRSMLSRLEDIGGCRAVLNDGEALEKVRLRIEKNWSKVITRRRDYVDRPKDMGYRAIHLTVLRDDRKIEVQLRTRGQQVWANAIESADSRLNLTLKDGEGPPSMLEYFSSLSEVIYHQEYATASPEMRQRLTNAENIVIDEGYYTRRTQ